jgi:hypothetical protein
MKAIITLNDQKWTVPTEITVSQFEQISQFGLEDPKAKKLICAIILGAPLTTFKAVADEELEMVFALCLAAMQGIEHGPKYTGPIDFDQISFGNFIDLDVLTHEGLDKNLVEAISILYAIEPDECHNQPVSLYWQGIVEWLACRDGVYTAYATFFGTNDVDAADASEAYEPSDIDHRRAWYYAVVALAGEDFMKIHQVVDRPLKECLNYLSYLKDEHRKKAEQQRQQLRMAKR